MSIIAITNTKRQETSRFFDSFTRYFTHRPQPRNLSIKPFLKWPGNKYRCLQHIIHDFPPANRLIEPFTGSGAIFLNTQYESYVLAEANQDLITLFHWVQQEKSSFIDYCRQFFSAKNNHPTRYYELREQFNSCCNPYERAAIFLYLNRHGYNGLCRYNQKGIYNVPFGRYIKPYFPHAELTYFHEKSQKAIFIHQDFQETFKLARAGDLIYCDPPYSPLRQHSNFSTYTQKKFGEQEHIALAHLAKNAANQGITVIISNHDTDFTRHHYEQATIKAFNVKRTISCHANKRAAAKELLAIFIG